jgi:hypothetical protein
MKSEVIGKFVPTHAMKAYSGSEGTALPILKLSTMTETTAGKNLDGKKCGLLCKSTVSALKCTD